MFDSNKLNAAFRGHDSTKVAGALGVDGLRDPVVARKFVTALRQSSCLTIQIESEAKEALRDHLVDKCRELLAQCPDVAVAQDFEDHVADARIVERGYRELIQTIRKSDVWKRTPSEQAWGMILRAERDSAYVKAKVDKKLADLSADKHPLVDPRQLKLEDENGVSVEPDALVNGIVKNCGDTLVMLAYLHNWFDGETGAIVLPAEVKVDETTVYQAGSYSLAACQWRCLEDAWDRSRFFKARFQLREHEYQVGQEGTRRCTVLEVQSATRSELTDCISLNRLEQMFFQSHMGLTFSGTTQKTSSASTTGPVPLAKAGYISQEERASVQVLDGSYCVSVDDDSLVVAGLPFKAWVRGYAYCAEKARDAAGNPILSCLRLSETDLVDGLVSAGLSNTQAKTFIGLITFTRGSVDLFDTPLLKVNDGSYCFFTPAYQTPAIGVIVLSRISSLNRRRDQQGEPANDCLFEDKGKLFENRVLNLFVEAKIPAYGFKYSLDGVDYDCDVAALIGDALFVFECKNRSLPMGHIPSLYYFTLALDEAQEQVKRIVLQFTEHPEIVRNHFGANAKWNRIVPVVLHALPWSDGCHDGVYIYDASALSHLLRDGFTSVCIVSRIDVHHIMRRHRYALRKGEIPTAYELEREMGDPNQVRLQALGWEQVAQPIPISNNFVFSLPELIQRVSTLEEQMIALGSTREEAKKRAQEMNEEFPEEVQKVREGLQSRSARRSVGRNDACPCGSGKKYKKCCLN